MCGEVEPDNLVSDAAYADPPLASPYQIAGELNRKWRKSKVQRSAPGPEGVERQFPKPIFDSANGVSNLHKLIVEETGRGIRLL